MSSSQRRSRLVVPAAFVLAALVAACNDPYTGPASHLPPVPLAEHQPEVTLFVGDTVSVASLIDVADGDAASCVSSDATVAWVAGAVDIVGSAAGDVSLYCTRAVLGDPTLIDYGDEFAEPAYYYYSVLVHVRAGEERA